MPAKKELFKDDILRAIRHTKSNRAAARYLGCSYQHYKPYAKLFNDDETGKNLFELHKKRKIMFDWVEEKFPASPLTRWRWLAESIVITKHALNNAEDAKRMADLLYIHAQNLDIPFWVWFVVC